MDYINHYNKLCSSRKLFKRDKSDGNYYELHHIKPKWLGGLDTEDNLVLFTAREHFIAHYLLFKHYKDRSSSAAFHIMCNTTNNDYRNSKKYAEVREFQSKILKGENNPAKRKEVRELISLKTKGENNGMYGRVKELNPFYGKKHSKEFLQRKKEIHGKKIIYNNNYYLSLRDAEKLTGISRYKIKKNCQYV